MAREITVSTYLERLGQAIHTVIRRSGRALLRGFGEVGDAVYAEGIEAARIARPATCDASALDAHARNDGLPRVPRESDDDLRDYLSDPWPIFAKMGTTDGLLEALRRLGYSSVSVVTETDYNLDGHTAAFGDERNFFHVDIDRPNGFGPPASWDAGESWDGGALWDLGAEPYEGALDWILATIRRWKPAGASCRHVRIRLPDDTWAVIPCAETWEYDAAGAIDESVSPYLHGV